MKRTALSFLAAFAMLGASAVSAQPVDPGAPPPPPAPTVSLGFLAEPSDIWGLPPLEPQDPAHPIHARLVAHWDDVEREKGVYDWSSLESIVTTLHEEGARVVLCLTGTNALYVSSGAPPSPTEGESLQAWVAFARSAVRAFSGKVAVYEIWDGPAGPAGATGAAYDPAVYAFVLKSTALAVRAEAKAAGFSVSIAQGALDAGSLDWQKTLWSQDVAPYVDILPLRFVADTPASEVAERVAGVFGEALLHPPAPKLWVYVETAPEAPPAAPLVAAVRALASSVAVAFGRVPAEDASISREVGWTLGVHRALGEGYAPGPIGSIGFLDLEGHETTGIEVLGRFVREKDLSTILVYDGSSRGTPGTQANLVLDTADVRDPKVIDPAIGQEYQSAALRVPGGGARTALGILITDHPMLLRFDRAAATPGFESQRQALEIKTARGLTAEEIIARYQEVQKVQDDRLLRWTALGRVDFHFKLAQAGSTVDFSIESNYLWERGGQLEWEQTDYYVNGNRVKWENIPELPLIQPEKVITLPLDLTLDKTYVYQLVGEDSVDGHPAYVLSFEPSDPSLSLYQGRVWIDKTTFVRLKASVIQTNLEAPVLSNEEVDVYQPIQAPDGQSYWMLSRIDGQQIWTAGGRNFVVRRELTFYTFELNPAQASFEETRRRAYASTHQMLRDTEKGFRYLERKDDGSRVVKESLDTSQFFAAAGVFKDSSFSTPVPLGGVNYFNYDMWGRKIQLNVFFAGLLAFVNASEPTLFGTRMDLAVEAIGIAIKGSDKVFANGEEVEPERIKTRRQDVALRLGIPAGNFLKFTLSGDVEFDSFFRADETDPAFVLPDDHQVMTGTAQAEFNRRGYTVTASGSWSRRSDWSPWGLPGGEGQPPLFDPDQKNYSTWGVSAFKEWYLPKFQKIRGEVNYLDGTNLDRFSRYRFTSFGGARLNGFSGTGVRFDTGTILRAGYSFNLFEIIRLDASAETARVEIKDDPLGAQQFTGAGLSGNFVGPWKTVISLSYGRALASDIPELVGKQEFLLVVLKLF